MIIRVEKFNRPASERLVAFAHRNEALHPPENRVWVILLRFHVERFVMGFGVNDDRKIQAMRARLGKTGVAVTAPLHWCTDGVAIAEVNIVAHADFIAVIENWSSGQ